MLKLTRQREKARDITGKTSKWLVGRVFSFYLWQVSFSEFIDVRAPRLSAYHIEKSALVKNFIYNGEDFSPLKTDIFLKNFIQYFEEYAIFGGYPEVIKTDDKETKNMILKNIYETYVTKDIVELLKITDIDTFRDIVGLLANQIANLVNYNSLAQDSRTYFKELKRYLSILEETFIINLISPFYSNITTEIKKSPKVYFVDTGLRNFILHSFNSISVRPDKGALIENTVLSLLRTSCRENSSIRYWRTLSKAEVDFILRYRGNIIPVEVKYSPINAPKISRSFRSFLSSYKPERAILLTKDFWGELRIDKTLIKFIPVGYI